MAVGEVFSPSDVPLAESWNGSSWTAQAQPPLPTGGTEGRFLGVSCSSARTCIAAGVYNNGSSGTPNRALAEIWNGTGWTVQATPSLSNTRVSGFNGVSCSHAGPCTAVGYLNRGRLQALAEHWNGTSWSVQSGTKPPNAQPSDFNGVSCATKTACTAVGDSGTLALAERHNA
jgi:hypothetical protein